MLRVLLGKEGVGCWYLPVDAEGVVNDAHAAICFWMIELITLILEDGCLGEDGKSMKEAAWHEELAMIVFGELYGNVLSVCWRPLAGINGNVENSTLHATNEL